MRFLINKQYESEFFDPKTKELVKGLIVDPELQFSDKNINKMINNFILNADSRFDPIMLKMQKTYANGKKEIVEVYYRFKGKEILPNNVYKELNRPLTVCDVMYLACYHTCKNRHVMVSRYPVGIDKGMFFTKINVETTKEHQHILYNGGEYKYYPKVHVNVPEDVAKYFGLEKDYKFSDEDVAKYFIDTLKVASSHLRVMSGD